MEEFYSIFREDVASPAPYCSSSNHIPIQLDHALSPPPHPGDPTYCSILSGDAMSTGSTGAAAVSPTRASCSAVLYLLMVVGLTSAEGSEKSQ